MPVHRATGRGWSSARGKILSGAWLGVLTYVIPPGLVDEAVGDGLAWEMRLRLLPARVTAYFTLGLCLFSGESYSRVFTRVTAGLGLASPASTALSAARRRLGEKTLESLFRRLCSPLSPGRAPWSHVCGLLAVAWDGTTADAADSPGNAAAFGRPATGKGRPPAAFPQLRLVTLVACGTRALLGAACGPLRGKGAGEQALAAQLLGSLRPGMLLLADRNFYSWQLWHAAAGAGADLLWRIKACQHLPVARELPDGSYLTRVSDPRAVKARAHKNGTRRRRGSRLPPDDSPLPGFTARVIAFTLAVTADDGTVTSQPYRLLTTLLDHRAFPAADLAAAYARRWAVELSYREWKTFLHGRALRGRTPDLARQELWACLAVYQAVRTLIARAAAATGTDPARLSFTAALDAARRTLPAARGRLPAALAQAETEILASPVPERKGRVYPRAVKKPAYRYPARNGSTSPVSQHARYTLTITTPRTTTPAPADQPANPSQQTKNPP